VWIESAFRISPYLDRLKAEGGAINLGALQADAPVAAVLEVGVAKRPPGEHRLMQIELTADIQSQGHSEKSRRDVSISFTPEETAPEAIQPNILSALTKITVYRMQERAWDTLEQGDVEKASQQLEMIATRLFDLGESRLARAAMLEAGRIAKGGTPTEKGRKELKYGTRSLTIASRRKSHD
jgi:Ca-activated chloride channel family protein